MADWIQIDPTLTKAGAFAALSSLPRADELKPVPADPNATTFGTRFSQGQAYSFSAAAQLGFGSVADASTSFQTRTFAYDLMYYAPGRTDKPNGDLIYGTFWGAGIRVRVEVTNFTAKVDLTLANIAAAASIGLVDASFSVEGLGIADVSIFKLLPPPGRFDDNSLKQILDAMNDVEANILIPKKNLVAVPFMIWVANAQLTFGDPVQRGKTQLFAIRRIKDGLEQDKAITAATNAGLDPLLVETIYTQWAGTNAGALKPTADAIRRAGDWLKTVNLG
jgi:hypothetical protein